MPVSLSHNYVYGSSLGLTYALQLVTGLVLTLHYQGTFDGLIIYLREVGDGQMIRYFHANGASLFLGLMFLHVARGLYYGSSNKKALWVSGVVLLLLSMGVAFLGYVLPYGQMSYWGATVIINLISVISMTAVVWIWGGYVVSKYTLTRFYTLHFLLPLVLAVLILGHLHALHGTGGSSLSYSPAKSSFFPLYSVKDAMIWAVVAFLFLNIALLYPNLLGDAENYISANPMVTPAHIKPEWYFLFAYAILRCIPNKALGVLALGLAVAIPVVHVLGFGGRHTFPMALMAVTFSLLTVVGGMVIVKHYSLMARLLTVVYFTVVVFMASEQRICCLQLAIVVGEIYSRGLSYVRLARVHRLFFPLLLGTINLFGLYAFPLGTNAAVVFLFVGSILISSYSVKPSVGALYHFGPEGVEPQSLVNVAGRPLSAFIGGLEALGLVIKIISLSLRLIANLSAGHILTGLLYGNGCPQGLIHSGWVTLLVFPAGLALLVLEVCVCYVQGFVFCTLLSQYWAEYTRASECRLV